MSEGRKEMQGVIAKEHEFHRHNSENYRFVLKLKVYERKTSQKYKQKLEFKNYCNLYSSLIVLLITSWKKFPFTSD